MQQYIAGGIVKEITTRQLMNDMDAESQLRFYAGLADNMQHAVMITPSFKGMYNPPILYVNRAFSKLTGYSPDEALGKTPKMLQGRRTDHRVMERLKHDLAEKGCFRGRAVNYRKNGTPFLMEWEIVPLRDPTGSSRYYLTIQREVNPSLS
jgi:PAS domain S-box-containing protein